MQFKDSSDYHLIQLILQLKKRSEEKGRFIQIDAYFALRVTLEFYILEKQAKVEQINKVFHKHMKILRHKMSFVDFKKFVRNCFSDNFITDSECLHLFRLTWSIGDGKITFDSFMAASTEMAIFVKQLNMENTASYCLTQFDTEIEEKADFLVSKEELAGKLIGYRNKIVFFEDQFSKMNHPHYIDMITKLKGLMDEDSKFRQREQLMH